MSNNDPTPQPDEQTSLQTRITELERALAAERAQRIYHEYLLSSINDAVISLDNQFRIREWNAAAERIYGWKADEVRGQHLKALVQPQYSYGSTSASALEEVLAHDIWTGIVTHYHRDGRELIIESAVRVMRDAQGNPSGLTGINRDVTSSYHAEAALRRSDAILRAFFDNAPQAQYLIDRDYRIIAFNRVTASDVRRIWKREIREGDSALDYVAPGSHDSFIEHFQRCLQGASSKYERYVAQPNGQSQWYELSYTPIFQDDNQVIGVAFSGLDIGERKRNEAAREAAETRYQLLVEQIPAVTYIVEFGERNITTYISPQVAGLLGYTPEEWLADSALWLGQIHPEDHTYALASLRKNADDPRPLNVEYRMLTRAGQVVWVHNTASPILRRPGQVGFSIGMLFDITARKQAEEERQRFDAKFQQMQRLESLGMLAGGIAHDFNNLLTGILGYADLALLELPPRSPARPLIGEAVSGARRAAELTAQMLAYSGKGRFVIESLDLSRLVEDITRLLEISVSKKCVLKYNLLPNLPSVAADATQIRQVIMNLVINASEAIGERSGVIMLSTGAMYCDSTYLSEAYLDENLPEGLYVYLEVADNGIGMSEETRSRVFEPFFSTKFTGRGLGLAAVLGIVRGHRGAIKVYSEPGGGTTFKVLFPATELPASAAETNLRQANEWRGSGTVLVIDDEETVRGLARRMLEHMGFAVLIASDGREGERLFRQHSAEIRLVVLDMTMPHMDGEETFRQLRRVRADVRVILTSGYNEQAVTSRFAGKGLAGFIQKPYRFEELYNVVRNVLDRA